MKKINAYIICMLNDSVSTYSTRRLIQSIYNTESNINPLVMDATTPESIERGLRDISYLGNPKSLDYTWPTQDSQNGLDMKTGLYKKAYKADDVNKVIACMVSHMRTWQTCIDLNEPIMVLEHDALFIRQFIYQDLLKPKSLKLDEGWFSRWKKTKELSVLPWEDNKKFVVLEEILKGDPTGEFTGGILGLNSPIGATRKASVFHKELFSNFGIHRVPSVDKIGDDPLPQGLAGNSAYIIKPWAAKKLLDKVREIGMWPNDALMCKQFFPWMQVCWPYYTVVQGTQSTTTG